MNKIKKIALFLLIPFTLTGCWDRIEIEERAYVSAVGIDLYNQNEEENEDEKLEGNNRYTFTYSYPNLEAIGQNGGDSPRFVVASVGSNSFESSRQVATRSNQGLFFKHLNSFIIGEEVARDPNVLREQFDSLERHHQIGRRIHIFIAQGTAKEIIEVESKYQPEPGQYLTEIARNRRVTAAFDPLLLGKLLEEIHFRGDVLIPRVTAAEEELKLGGAAIIKDFKLIGWINEVENQGVMYIRNEIESDIVTVDVNGIQVPFIITESKTKRTVTGEADDLKAIVDIELEGYMQQFRLATGEDVLEEDLIRDIERAVEELLKQRIRKTLNKLQKEFKADVIGLGKHIHRYKPGLWLEIEDDWEEIFTDIPIEVNITAHLRRVGMTR